MEKLVGLTSTQAQQRLEEIGQNVLPEKPPTSDTTIFIRQVQSPLIYILLIASGISFFLKDTSDALIILFAVIVNTILGFYQERKAEKGLYALRKILTPTAKVMRDGHQLDIEAKLIVPGDVVVVTAGDKIPADGYLVECSSLIVNESILTGESVPITKEKSQIADRSGKLDIQKITANSKLRTANSSVFMGTTVVGGVGKFVVTGTGLNTEIGKIAHTLSETEEEETPLQKRFADLARTLTIVVVIAAVTVFVTGMLRNEPFVEMFATSVAVAVAAIPEGLVIALTAILALGMQRIFKRKALVRKLVVAETLGTVTVIATDKTGTLTEGRLKVVKTDFVDKREALEAAAYANQLLDPLEFALWEYLTSQKGFDPEEIKELHNKEHVLPFSGDHRFSAQIYDHALFSLGAPEVIISRSTLSFDEKEKYLREVEDWAKQGMRILAVAHKHLKKMPKVRNHHEVDRLEFLGLIGFADPVRQGVKDALNLCREAGIKVKVVTGDYRYTAEHVMKQVGLAVAHPDSEILEGEELEHLSTKELIKRVNDIKLFARVTPNQKLKIVEALKAKGEIVALLGDGVNDAPAIKRSDIGIVVGEASDVARETADLILLDSNFSTIVGAVEEGRGIFTNIQKVMVYLLSDTFAEVTLIFLGLVFNVPLPLTAAQILWINLVTDTFPTLALTMEPKEKNLLKRPPIPTDLPILSPTILLFTLIISLTSGILVFLLYLYILKTTGSIETARLIAFTTFALKSLLYVFSLRQRRKFFWQIHHLTNKWLLLGVGLSFCIQLLGLLVLPMQKLLSTRALTSSEWGVVIGASFLILLIIESVKVARSLTIRK